MSSNYPEHVTMQSHDIDSIEVLRRQTRNALDAGVRSATRFDRLSTFNSIRSIQWFTAMRSIGYLMVYKTADVEAVPYTEEDIIDDAVTVEGSLAASMLEFRSSIELSRRRAHYVTNETAVRHLPKGLKIPIGHFIAGEIIFGAYNKLQQELEGAEAIEAPSDLAATTEAEAA